MRINIALIFILASVILSCNNKRGKDSANLEKSSGEITLKNDSTDRIIAVMQDAMKRNKYWYHQDIRAKYYNKLSNKYLLKDNNNQSYLRKKKTWYGKYDKIEIVDSAYVKEHGLSNCMIGRVHYEKDSIRVSFCVHNRGRYYAFHYLKNNQGIYEFSRIEDIRFKPKFNKFWTDVDAKSNQLMEKQGYDFESFVNKKFIDKDTFYVFINQKDSLIEKDTVNNNIIYRFYYNDYRTLHKTRLEKSKQLNAESGKMVVDLPEEPSVSFQFSGKTRILANLPKKYFFKLTRKDFRSHSMRTRHSVFYIIEIDRGYKLTPSKMKSCLW